VLLSLGYIVLDIATTQAGKGLHSLDLPSKIMIQGMCNNKIVVLIVLPVIRVISIVK
jgi:antibiotic biosynthesis monooxygenase (ABM) superfamily enzyme